MRPVVFIPWWLWLLGIPFYLVGLLIYGMGYVVVMSIALLIELTIHLIRKARR